MVYKWKPGSIHKVDAEVAGSVCEQLEQQGNLSAKSLLEASRPEDAPLHNEFEWDNEKAAEKYREEQARGIIRNLTVVIDNSEPVRKFFNVSVKSEKQYTRIETILETADMRASLLSQALSELENFRKKYSQLEELAEIFKAMEKTERET